MAQNAASVKAWRIRSGRQRTLPIPVEILANVLTGGDLSAITEHLGSEMVQALRDKAKSS